MRVINKDKFYTKPQKKLCREFREFHRDYGLEEMTEMAEIRRLAEIESKYRQNW